MIDRQRVTALLPDGTTASLIAGELTIDETMTPYIQASVTIPAPADLGPFDPRVIVPPRVAVTLTQGWDDPVSVADLTAIGGSASAFTARFGGKVSNVTAAFFRWLNPSNTRATVVKKLDLMIVAYDDSTPGELVLELASDDALTDLGYTIGVYFNGTYYSPSLFDYVLTYVGIFGPNDNFVEQPSTSTALTSFFPDAHDASGNSIPVHWLAGQSVSDFIGPMLQSVGLRMWVDEARGWHLTTDPRNVAGTITLNDPKRAHSVDRSGGDREWFSHVAVRYTWQDNNGAAWDTTDYYPHVAQGGKVYTVDRELSTGPSSRTVNAGAAQYIYNRLTDIGYSETLTATNDFAAAPGMAVNATLVDGSTVVGRISSVTMQLVATAEMTITLRNVTE